MHKMLKLTKSCRLFSNYSITHRQVPNEFQFSKFRIKATTSHPQREISGGQCMNNKIGHLYVPVGRISSRKKKGTAGIC